MASVKERFNHMSGYFNKVVAVPGSDVGDEVVNVVIVGTMQTVLRFKVTLFRPPPILTTYKYKESQSNR
jgi:hypothetical protein